MVKKHRKYSPWAATHRLADKSTPILQEYHKCLLLFIVFGYLRLARQLPLVLLANPLAPESLWRRSGDCSPFISSTFFRFGERLPMLVPMASAINTVAADDQRWPQPTTNQQHQQPARITNNQPAQHSSRPSNNQSKNSCG